MWLYLASCLPKLQATQDSKLVCKSVFSNGMMCINVLQWCQKICDIKLYCLCFLISANCFSHITLLCITRTFADALLFSVVSIMRLSLASISHRDNHFETARATTKQDLFFRLKSPALFIVFLQCFI
jgi:hypothetical protein